VTKPQSNSTGAYQQRAQTANVLIVDNSPQLARFMLEILARRGIRGTITKNQKDALALLEKGSYDLVFTSTKLSCRTDLSDTHEPALELVRNIKADSPELPVIIIAENQHDQAQNHQYLLHDPQYSLLHRTTRMAMDALRSGCHDFLIQPLETKKIENLLSALLPNRRTATIDSAEADTRTLYTIIGKSPKLAQIVQLANRIAPTSAPVLISGESGTGKELLAYLLHHKSKRAHGPYVKVNCAALTDSLLESELFGHEKGAFTGAYTRRKGRFEMAHGGTLLLDEITETPPKFQAKLLRTLEHHNFERVGGNENVKVNIRIISTTNKDLLHEVSEGRLRQDLYYRISGLRLVIPSLRERTEDLPELVWHFVNLYVRQANRHITSLDPAMMDIFAEYHWPGNVRQLRNVVLTSLILGVGPVLSLADVSWLFDELQPLPQQKQYGFAEQTKNPEPDPCQKSGLAGIPLQQIERRAILETLHQTDGNQTKAAKVLGISDRTLRDKIRRYRQQGCLQPT
jgi:DNA-binding NtrC family response regulator